MILQKNRTYFVFLFMFIITALFQVKTLAGLYGNEEGDCGLCVTYSFNESDGVLTISGTGTMDTYNTKAAPWESFKDSIRCIIVTGNVYKIGSNAFTYCENLYKVILSEGVKNISDFAFSNCTNLKELNLPSNVNYIGKSAFTNCQNLEELHILGNVQFIGYRAFGNCKMLNKVDIQGDVEEICEAAFSGCEKLKEVTIKGNLMNIKDGAFCNCARLSSFSYFGNVEQENENVFLYCPSLSTIKVSENYKSRYFCGIQALHPAEVTNESKARRYYAAYGSNLNIQQMKKRCPNAQIVGISKLTDYELLFKGSKTNACLTIGPKEGSKVPVAIWSVTPEDELALDRYEGFPIFYHKVNMELPVKIEPEEVKSYKTFMYIMQEDEPFGVPDSSYVKICQAGYKKFGFNDEVLLQALLNGKKYCGEE